MKQRLSVIITLIALVAVLLTGCSIQESASAVLPVVATVAGNVAGTVEQQLPTVAAQANATLQEVAQVAPTAEPVAPVTDPAPAVIEPVPVVPTSQEQQIIDLYNRVNPGVVTIYMTSGSGSGFIIDAEGYIVTNNHVIAEGGEINVLFHDGDVKKAELVGTDPQADIALLKVE
ncbi:MAG TPA: trypsin-like peptidase domain-containing protein, partial [Promineifilum sp.]|nr:trypsin-like peptidase domain-containing protein [Promineifilum sp.]